MRPNGSDKGKGYFGALVNKDGDVVTEMTIGVNIDGEEVDIPLVHPFMSGAEINEVLNLKADEKIPEKLVKGAVDYAMYRFQQGLPAYATPEEEGTIPLPKGVKQYTSPLGLPQGGASKSSKKQTRSSLGVK